MWCSGDISTPTARLIASEIRRKKRLAYHVMSLRMSKISKDVLENSDLQDALELHFNHSGIGIAVRELLERFLNISQDKEDRINQLFEAKNGVSPFRQSKNKKRTPRMRIKIRFGKEERKEPGVSEDSEETESDYSDTDSETECSLQKVLEARKQEEKETEMEEELEKGEEKPAEQMEIEKKRKRKGDGSVEMVAKQPKLEPLSPQEALPVDPLPCKDEQELNLVVKELLHQIKKDLNGKPMEQKIGQKKKDRKRGMEKKEIKLILTDVTPKTLKKVKKEPKEPKIFKEKKEKTLKKTEQKEEKPVLLARKSLVERNGNIPNSVEMKPLLPAKQAKSAEMKATADPVKQLAETLNALPLAPSRDQILPLLTNLTSALLSAAEIHIGRNMRRVDWLWWELIFRDFGPIDRTSCAGDVRDIYAAKQLFAERKKKREMGEREQKPSVSSLSL